VTFKEWKDQMKEHLAEEWAFHKRHPEMFIPLAILAYGLYDAFFK
jgi:hypothetical protein